MKPVKSLMFVMALSLILLAGCVNVIEAPEDEATSDDHVSDDAMMEKEASDEDAEGSDIRMDIEKEDSMIGDLELKEDSDPEIMIKEDDEMMKVEPVEEVVIEPIEIELDAMKKVTQ